MLKRAGIPSELRDEDLRGPTQVRHVLVLTIIVVAITLYSCACHYLLDAQAVGLSPEGADHL